MNLVSMTIPNGVTRIENYTFLGCHSLTSITLPNSITSIGNNAFWACSSLPSMTLPDNVITIGSHAFDECISLTSITIPNSVTTIGSQAFVFCEKLTSISLSNNLTTIGFGAFIECKSLTSITIPSSVKSIGEWVFYYCESLTSIDVENENNHFSSEDGILYNKDKTTLICCPAGKTSIYDIPNSVTKIDYSAFSTCTHLTSIILPNSVIIIEEEAFSYCTNLTSMTIPNGVTHVKYGTFGACTSLSSITIPKSVILIGSHAFANCRNLTSITNLNPNPIFLYSDVFSGVNQSQCTMEVPTSAVSAYQNAVVWKEFNIVGGGIAVNPTTNINRYGYTMGEGLYEAGDMVDVMAVAYDGYKFVNWTKDGVEVSDRELYIFTVTEDVELIANFEKDDVGIDELRVTNYELQVYPNPVNYELKITNYMGGAVEIFNLMGRRVMFFESLPLHKVTIDASPLPNGIYFLKIGKNTVKFVKQ